MRELSEEDVREVSRRVAEAVVDYISQRVQPKHIYVIDVHVELRRSEEGGYVLDVFAYLDVNPFCGVDPDRLLDEAIDAGFEVARRELGRLGVREVERGG